MIIVRTPHRLSICGGGSDTIPHLKSGKYGLVVGFGLAQYNTVSLRYLPPFFPDVKTRLSYSQIEKVKSNQDIEHKVIKAALDYFQLDDGFEITNISDVPSGSGLGSSSCFLVSLIHALAVIKNYRPTSTDLYMWASHIEQNLLKEHVGLQDTAWSAFGGIGYFKFKSREEIQYTPLLYTQEQLQELSKFLLLFYTNTPRSSHDMASKYYGNLPSQAYSMDRLIDLTNMSIELLKERQFMKVGQLMGQSWEIKKSLHPEICPPNILDVEQKVKKLGGFGKLTGSGKSGCFFVFAPPEQHDKIRAELRNLTEIKVQIAFKGSELIYNGERE